MSYNESTCPLWEKPSTLTDVCLNGHNHLQLLHFNRHSKGKTALFSHRSQINRHVNGLHLLLFNFISLIRWFEVFLELLLHPEDTFLTMWCKRKWILYVMKLTLYLTATRNTQNNDVVRTSQDTNLISKNEYIHIFIITCVIFLGLPHLRLQMSLLIQPLTLSFKPPL